MCMGGGLCRSAVDGALPYSYLSVSRYVPVVRDVEQFDMGFHGRGVQLEVEAQKESRDPLAGVP